MNQKQLEIFTTLAGNLNFTKTAELLYLSQTTVTFQIHSLEEELQVKLLERTSRSVRLTPAGMVFLEDAKQILNLMKQSMNNANIASNGYTGVIELGFAVETNTIGISGLIKEFVAKHPEVKVNTHGGYPDSLLDGLLQDKYDLIATPHLNRLNSEHLEYYRLGQYKQIAAFHKDHPFAKKKKLQYSDFNGERFICVSNIENELDFTGEFIRQLNKRQICPDIYTYTDNIDSVFLMLEANLGVTVIPGYFEERLHGSSKIRTCKINEDLNGANLLALWKSGKQSPELEQFLSIMRDYFPG